MPLRNRVTPPSEVIAGPGRGHVYGNRGRLHDDTGRIVRFAATRSLIACRLIHEDSHRHPLRQPGRYTELFFLDEATVFAACTPPASRTCPTARW